MEKSTEFQKKSPFSRKLKIMDSSHALKQRLFYQKTFLIQNVDYHGKNGKRNWVSALLSSEMHYFSIRQRLILSPMENYQVFLLIFLAVYIYLFDVTEVKQP